MKFPSLRPNALGGCNVKIQDLTPSICGRLTPSKFTPDAQSFQRLTPSLIVQVFNRSTDER